MQTAAFKVIAIFLMATFLVGYTNSSLLAKEQTLCFGQIVHIDEAQGFVVINLGRVDGIKKGNVFNVYRDEQKVGEIKAIKLRQSFSACDIECTYEGITLEVGDRVEFSRKKAICEEPGRKGLLERQKIDSLLIQAQEYVNAGEYDLARKKICQVLQLDPERTRALEMLSEIKRAILQQGVDKILMQARVYLKQMEYDLAEEKVREALEIDPENRNAVVMLKQIEEFLRRVAEMEPQIITVDIDAPKGVILDACLDIFQRYGCLITFSDPVEHNLHASKYIHLPFASKAFSEWGPLTKNKVYYNVQIKQSPSSEYQILNRLIICLTGAYESEGKIRNYKTKENSPTYKETEEMAFRIKNLAEEL